MGVGAAQTAQPEPGLLFYLSGSHGLTADYSAGGTPEPNFASEVTVIPDGAKGPGLQCGHTQLLSYWAPGNIYAQRGTLAFSWRSRESVGPTPFPVFRVGYADHSSWDMAWLRIDYNGKSGFDAFVTDASLARTRVSWSMPAFPAPSAWTHLALAWDETRGIRFYVNGALVASREGQARFDAALDQFGPHSRIISPYQVQSAYNFVRGGDIDEVRIYDRMLSDDNVKSLAGGAAPQAVPALERALSTPAWQQEWWYRYGWNRPGDVPPSADGPAVRVRKVEIHEAYDLKRWMWKGTDGIRETTWPGVYNRSRLPGRNDYFQLPDWDCYSLSGKAVTFAVPDEPWNQVEISGAAFGSARVAAGSGRRRDVTLRAPEGTGADGAPPGATAARRAADLHERRAGNAHRRTVRLQRRGRPRARRDWPPHVPPGPARDRRSSRRGAARQLHQRPSPGRRARDHDGAAIGRRRSRRPASPDWPAAPGRSARDGRRRHAARAHHHPGGLS